MKASAKFIVRGYVDGKEVLSQEISVPKNAPAKWGRLRALSETAARQVIDEMERKFDARGDDDFGEAERTNGASLEMVTAFPTWGFTGERPSSGDKR